jgi:hypothetical protein
MDSTPVTIVGAPPAPVTTIDPIDAPPPPSPVSGGRGRRGRGWLVVTAVAILVLTGAGAVVAVLQLTGHDDHRVSAETTVSATTPTRTAKPLAPQIAFRVRRDIVPLQRQVNLELRALAYDRTPMRGVSRAAGRLERKLLELQGWAAGLRPRTAKDRAVLAAFRKTLSEHALYANFVADISPESKVLQPWIANKAVSRADAARDAYFRLHGAASVIPVVPLPVDAQDRVTAMIVREKPKPPQPASQPTTPTATEPTATQPPPSSADDAAIRNVIASHWQAINAGDYYGAYALFSPAFKRRATAAGWVGDKKIDRPQSSPVSVGGVKVSGSTATAYVAFTTRGSETSAGNTGCNRWNGSYTLVEVGGTWYIDTSHLVRTSLDCSAYRG